MLYDGFSTTVGSSTTTGLLFREKTVTPFDNDGGGALDTSDMRNVRYRTKAPKSLISSGQLKMTVYYDPAFIIQIQAALQVNQLWTLRMPNGNGVKFWGWLEKFTPPEHNEGKEPIADIIIEVSNASNGPLGKADGPEVAPVEAISIPIPNH